MNTAGLSNEIAMDTTNLTQLSSREQLSALMDGALPADETRFLLRRLQHDSSLAECWERWRLSAEVMRGLAPTQRLPSDFASRVAASLREGELHATSSTNTASAASAGVRSPAWLRWGGGAAMAASLAVVALMTQHAGSKSPGSVPGTTIVATTNAPRSAASDAIAAANSATPNKPAPQAPTRDPANGGFESQTAALASAVAIMAKPSRNSRGAGNQLRVIQSAAMLPTGSDVQAAVVGNAIAVNDVQPLMPQAGIVGRPWPRSVLPQYVSTGMSVGFGVSARNSAPYNPFQVRTQFGNLPSKLLGHVDAQAETPSASDRNGDGQNRAGVSESSPQP